jgi:hypothetical protein
VRSSYCSHNISSTNTQSSKKEASGSVVYHQQKLQNINIKKISAYSKHISYKKKHLLKKLNFKTFIKKTINHIR